MIKIEMTFGSYAEVVTAMYALAGVAVKGAPTLKVVEKATDRVEKAAEPKAEKAAAKAQEPAAKVEKTEPAAVTYLDVKMAAGALAKTPEGRAKVVAIFKKYGAAVGTDLTAEQWPHVLADVKAAGDE